MDVAVYPDLPLLNVSIVFEKLPHEVDLGVDVYVGCYPLAIKVDS